MDKNGRNRGQKSDIMTVMRAGFVKDYVLCREEASFFTLSFQFDVIGGRSCGLVREME